jgi:hypothetical protein
VGQVAALADAIGCFGNAATHDGNPATVLSDNAAVFTGRSRGQDPCEWHDSGTASEHHRAAWR